MSPNDIKSLLINLLASVVFLFLTWLIPTLLGISQPISLIFILLGVLVGGFLGWGFHFLRTLRIARVRIGGYTTDLNNLAQSTHIDMMGVTLHAFIDFRGPVRNAIFNHNAQVRVLLLDPSCELFKKFGTRPGGQTPSLQGESQDVVDVIKAINESVETIQKGGGIRDQKPVRGRIEYKYYDSIPFCGLIITNRTVRYWPYLNHFHSSEVPTYQVSPNSDIAKTLANEFQRVWDESHLNP